MSSELILKAICESPVLVGDCPEAASLIRSEFVLPRDQTELSLNQKLGHLYEEALALILRASARYQLLEKSLQLQDGIHKTLGELDYLFRDQVDGTLVHLELAVKFYLAVETPEGLVLPGPDARDNYFKKISHLRSHQLMLTQRYRNHLPTAYHALKITPQHLILGCLFDHIKASQPANPEFLHPQARRGKWLRESELSQYFPNRKIEIIPKYLWPVPTSHLEDFPLTQFKPSALITRCVMLKIEGETKPIFLTPDRYPKAH